MARKRRAPSPPPPPQESSTDSASDTDGESSRRAAAHQNSSQHPQPHPPAAAAYGADSSDEEPDSDVDVHAFQMRPVSHPGSDADESSESEPEVPEPVQKKAEDKKRPAPEPAPSGWAKKAKAETGKATPETSPAGKGKKANAEREKAAPEATPAGKRKRAKKPVGQPENPGLDPSPPSKSARAPHRWSNEDTIKILEAMAAHVKTEGTLPKTDVLLAAVRDHLDRRDCSYSDIYERVRRLKDRYEKAVGKGVVPSEEDELQMYNLSEEIWGEKAKEAMAATASQNNSTVAKGKKGQVKKKLDGNSKGDTVAEVPYQNGDIVKKGSKKDHAVEVKTDKNVKLKLPKEDITAASPSKSKKLGSDKRELGKDAKSGTFNETATQNGDAMTKHKRGKMDIDLMPKEASTGSQNRGARTEEEDHQEETEIGASAQGTHRSFDELQDLYPCLTGCVKRIEAEHPCGETLKRAFGFIDNEKANLLESKIKELSLLEMKAQIRREGLQKDILNMLMSMAE